MGWPCDFNTISFASESPSLIGCRNWNCAAADSGPVYQRSSLLPLPPLQKPNPLLLVWGASHGRVATALRCSPCPDYVNVQLWLTRWLPRQRAALSAVRPVCVCPPRSFLQGVRGDGGAWLILWTMFVCCVRRFSEWQWKITGARRS